MSSSQGADAPMLSDAFMAFRLMMNYLDDIAVTVDSTTGRQRSTAIIESGTITTVGTVTSVTTVTTVATITTLSNITNIGGNTASSFVFDTMDIVFNTGIRSQII